MHSLQEPHLVNNEEDGLKGQGIRDIMGSWCKTWAEEGGESGGIWFVLHGILFLKILV